MPAGVALQRGTSRTSRESVEEVIEDLWLGIGDWGLKGTPYGVEAVGALLDVRQELSGGDRAGSGAERLGETEDVVSKEDALLELASTHVG